MRCCVGQHRARGFPFWRCWYAHLLRGHRRSRHCRTLGADQVVQRLMEKNKERADSLQHYTATHQLSAGIPGLPYLYRGDDGSGSEL